MGNSSSIPQPGGAFPPLFAWTRPCLGRADDLAFDPATARLQSLILLGRPRLFGLLGREENLTIPWQEIETIGTDAVLVHTQLPSAAPSKPGLWQSLRARLGL